MAFIEDVLCSLGLGKEITPYSHRITIYGKCGCLIEGVKKIVCFSKTQVEILLKTGVLIVLGENLQIKKYGDGEIALIGLISGVSYK